MREINLNKRGKYGKSKDKALTPAQARDLYKSLSTHKDRVIFILTAYAGLRVGELTQIRKEWLERLNFNDVEVLKINIPDECRDIKNKYKIWRPKTKYGRTTYIFEKELFLEVENWFEHNESIGLSYRGLQDLAYRKFNNSLHPLRSTAQNYFYYEKELPVRVIAQLLGHKDEKTTLKHYASMNNQQTEAFLMNKLSKE